MDNALNTASAARHRGHWMIRAPSSVGKKMLIVSSALKEVKSFGKMGIYPAVTLHQILMP